MKKDTIKAAVYIFVALIAAGVAFWWIVTPPGLESSVDPEWDLAKVVPPESSARYEEAVGPAGNPYVDPEFYRKRPSIPVESLPSPVQTIIGLVVPEQAEFQIQEMSSATANVWRIVAETQAGNSYLLSIEPKGRILMIGAVVDDILEYQGRIFRKGGIKEIPIREVPRIVLDKAEAAGFGLEPTKAYAVEGEAGQRYFIQLGDEKGGTIFCLTENGQIRAAGQVPRMLRPLVPRREESLDEITDNLAKYGDKFHIDTMIARIKKVRFNRSEGFRFVVLGDSRSNLRVWQSIVYSINQWEPLFIIDIGDLTPAGRSRTMDRYHFATLEEYSGYPFFPVMGNHDCGGTQAFEYAFGGPESRVYFFDYGKCRFVILDNCECQEGMPWEDQLDLADKWLSQKQGYRKFVFVHLPPPEIEKWAYHSMSPKMSAPFVKLMSKHRVNHVFLGHIHAYSTAAYDGVEYTVTGGAGAGLHDQYGELGSHHHYLVVDVLRDRIDMKLVRLLPKDAETRVR